ncbi:transposase [Mesorhizobium loti]|uniref:transposase n=1 Tax=Rhizobium loti TaxID=381 RepID=UPI003D7C24E7
MATLAEIYVQGVSTRKVKAITEELSGHAFTASSISAIDKRLDESLKAFAERPLQEPFAYLILDSRYEKVREAGIVTSQAVLSAIGMDWDGRRQILAVGWPIARAARPGRTSSWRSRRRGLRGVELVVSDDHGGLVAAIGEADPGSGLTALLHPLPPKCARSSAEETWRRLPAGAALAGPASFDGAGRAAPGDRSHDVARVRATDKASSRRSLRQFDSVGKAGRIADKMLSRGFLSPKRCNGDRQRDQSRI